MYLVPDLKQFPLRLLQASSALRALQILQVTKLSSAVEGLLKIAADAKKTYSPQKPDPRQVHAAGTVPEAASPRLPKHRPTLQAVFLHEPQNGKSQEPMVAQIRRRNPILHKPFERR